MSTILCIVCPPSVAAVWRRKESRNPIEWASSSNEEASSALMRGLLGWGVIGVLQPSVMLPGDLRDDILGGGAGEEALN